MKIDKKVYALRNANERHVSRRGKTTVYHLVDRDIVEEVIDDLEELKWYRDQDLIKRSDLDDVVEEEYRCSNCNNHAREDCKWCVANSFKQIPKAEPPIDECTPNCEKRFTCKHCIQGMYCNSRTGNEDGTPCCCEPEV